MNITKKHWKKATAIIVMFAILCSMKYWNITNQADNSKKVKAATQSNEETDPHIWIECNATTIKKGDVIEVKLFVKDIPSINGMEAVLDSDKDVFDEKYEINISPEKQAIQWQGGGFNPQIGKFILMNDFGDIITDKCHLATLKLTAKKDCEKSTLSLRNALISTKEFESVRFSDYSCTIPASSSDPNIGNNTPISHLYTDHNYTTTVTDNSIVLYANGSTVTVDNQKTNYKQATVYTDISASYLYSTNAKGKLKAATGKVIAGITKSFAKPELTKGKIVDKEAAKIASASVKNGIVTITAKTQSGTVYLWIMDTGKLGTYTCCPITVKAAPTSLSLYAIPNSDNTFLYGKTKKYTSGKLAVLDSTNVYLYPTYKENKSAIMTTDATYFASVDNKSTDYFTVQQSSVNPYCFTITAIGLKNNKTTTGKINIICRQNGKKATFTVKALKQ